VSAAAIELSDLEEGTAEGERLSQYRTIVDLVRTYETAVADIRTAFALLQGVGERMDAAFNLDEPFGRTYLRSHHGRPVEVSDRDAEATIARLRLDVWGHLVDRLEVRRFLSIQRATELDQMLQDKTSEKLPDITVDNVLAFARGLRSQVPDMLGEAVEEVFSWLRPPRSEYKTNTELEIGRRVILGYMVEWGWLGRTGVDQHGYRVTYGREQHLRALENVFTALDGKGSITKTYESRLADAIRGPAGKGETEYFRFRCFRNRNLHLEFKRLDLLDRFNKIAGGRRLRPAAE
jgi:hypothetical protein